VSAVRFGWPNQSERWRGSEAPGKLDALGFPPGGDGGRTVSTIHEPRADVALVRRTAAWLRADPERARRAGLACDADVAVLAALLDLLAAELPYVDAEVRREVVEACRQALG
jgi:hypothetical protein